MKRSGKENSLFDYSLNIWNINDFRMSGVGEKSRFHGAVRHFRKCLKWSRQRIVRGFADCDIWNLDHHIQHLMPAMLQHVKDNRNGSPSILGENYTNEDGILVNDTCHAEWDRILDRMIFLWRESDESTCSKKNPYEKKHWKASNDFHKKYGMFGRKLMTKEEQERANKGGGCVVHFMSELPEYREIYAKYRRADERLSKYRSNCKNEAIDMLKKYFDVLWD